MNFRDQRMAQLIRDELSHLILKEVEFEEGALVTVTDVEVTKKLDYAKVMISIIPSNLADKAIRTLDEKRGLLQHELNHKLNLKPMPHIRFEIDHGPENAAQVEKVFLETGIDTEESKESE